MAAQTTCQGYYTNISKPLLPVARLNFLNDYWKAGLSERSFSNQYANFEPYFWNYETLCRQQSPNGLGKLRHVDIFYALQLAIDPPISHLDQLMNEFIRDWINFAGKALLLISIADWPGAQLLSDYLKNETFQSSKQTDDFRFSTKKFNAMKLDLIGGMRPRWTSVMSDHLALEEAGEQVALFHQKYILKFFQQSGLFPDNSLIDDARQTFNLIFPPCQSRPQKWFHREASRKGWRATHQLIDRTVADSEYLPSSQFGIEKFDRFRDRLIILKQEYDDHEPEGIRQYWHDYRKPAGWWAFWVAVLLFVFVVGEVVEGAIQCFKAFHPSHV